jgi:hypothetical protein
MELPRHVNGVMTWVKDVQNIGPKGLRLAKCRQTHETKRLTAKADPELVIGPQALSVDGSGVTPDAQQDGVSTSGKTFGERRCLFGGCACEVTLTNYENP